MGTRNENVTAAGLELHTSAQKYADSPFVIVVVSYRISVWKAVARNN
jgi:hypothetical protein